MTEKKTHIGIPPFYMAASIYNTGQAHDCYFGDEGFIRPCFLKLRTKEERPKDTCQTAGKNLGIIPVSRRIADSGKWNFDVSKYLMHLASFKHPLSCALVRDSNNHCPLRTLCICWLWDVLQRVWG